MLEVTIRVIPYGLVSESHIITEKFYIWNVGGNIEFGDYECQFGTDTKSIGERTIKKLKKHKRNDGAWELLYKCLGKFYDKK